MAAIAVQDLNLDGLVNPTMTAAAALGDTVQNSDERVFIYAVNGSAGTINITANAQRNCNHGYIHDEVLTLLAGEDGYLGPFDKERFNTSTGDVSLTYDDVTSLTIAAIRLTVAP